MLVLCMYVQPEMVKCQFFFRFFPQQQFDRQFSFRVEVLNHMGWYLGHKGLLAPTPPSQCGHVSILGQRTHWFWSRSPFCSKLGHLFRFFRSPSYLGTMYFSLPFIPSNQLISAQMESTCFKGILTCALFLKSRDFRDIKNYIRERFPKKEGEKTNNHR